MRCFLFAFILSIVPVTSHAQSNGYSLYDAPWADETYEVCAIPNEDGLRAVIFKPKIEQGTTTFKVRDSKLAAKPGANGGEWSIIERVDDKEIPATFIHLKEQKVGFLNKDDKWVTRAGQPIRETSDLENFTGDSDSGIYPIFRKEDYQPDPSHEEIFNEAMMLMESMPDCTAHYTMGPFAINTETISQKYGSNNPLECAQDGKVFHGTKFDRTSTAYRRVIKYLHSDNFYLRLPGGEIRTYRGHVFPGLNSAQIDPDKVCTWKTVYERQMEK